MSAATEPGSTPRTQVRRIADRAVHDRDALHAVLDAGLVAHVSVIDDGQPYVLPVAYARDGDAVVFHGSTGSRLFRLLADGQPMCLTVTHLDGLVLARSAFESSMNYRSVMVLGTARRLDGQDASDALLRITAHLLPGREKDARAATKKEQAATMVLSLPLDECSVKVRTGGPEDLPEDLNDPELRKVWAGHVPMATVFGEPVPCDTNLPGTPVPDYIAGW